MFLVVGAFAVAGGVLFLWLRLRAELARRRQMRARVLLEDLLKHVYTEQHEDRQATVPFLAGHLGIAAEKVWRLIRQSEASGLLESGSGRLRLTEEGEKWAVQVIRAHRLWETWLAEEARLPASQLHRTAEREEHRLTAARQVDELDAHLGHPRRDPHGDPIPTASGDIARRDAQPLTSWPPGRPAEIAHVEDEPEEVFRAIAGMGLRPGSTVQIVRQTPEQLTLSDGEREHELAPLVAGNIQVVAAAAGSQAKKSLVRLSDLRTGEEAEVMLLDEELRGFTRRRLLDLGLTTNSRVRVSLRNAFGDPLAFRVRGTTIALRKDQASLIWVKPAGAATEGRVR